MNKAEEIALNEKLLKFVYPKARLRYKDEDGLDLFTPEYIASGKSFRTHMIDAKPIPAFTRDLNACFILLVPKIELDQCNELAFLLDKERGYTCRFSHGDEHYYGTGVNPAVAFCFAVENLIDTGWSPNS